MNRVTEENDLGFLLGGLILLLLASALIEQFLSGTGQWLIDSLTALTLSVGVWSISTGSMWFRAGAGLAATTLLVVITKWFLDLAGLKYLHMLTMLLFFLLTAALAMRQVLFIGPVNRHKLIGAICIFLLLGMIWTMLNVMAESLSPGAFNGLQHDGNAVGVLDWQNHFPDLTYFSFVTLTTVGYGDVTPASPLARFLAYLEAIVGQLYVAILVASLVGAHLASGGHRLSEKGDDSTHR